MSTQPRTARPSGSASVTAKRLFSLADVSQEGRPLPNRYGLYAPVGFGKTSLPAFAPSPIFIETKGETGLETLIQSGQLPPVPHFPEVETWPELLSAIDTLRKEDHGYKTLILDTGNGAEQLMHRYVCERDFDGDWTDRGFMGYMRGYEVSLADWRMFLNSLDDLRRDRGMTVFMLFHSRIKTFKNPAGPDFDRYTPEMHDKTWSLTKGWLDCILFGNFEVAVRTTGKAGDTTKKGKAAETAPRILYTDSNNPTFDAKNRFGLPAEIDMGESAKDGWHNFATALRESRKQQVQ